MSTLKVIAIDPASYKTGYAVKDEEISFGEIILPKVSLPERLSIFYGDLMDLVAAHNPQIIAAEDQFIHKNLNTFKTIAAIKDVAMLVAGLVGAEFTAYAPQHIKKVVVGSGKATKAQVMEAVHNIYNIETSLTDNEADALAVLYTFCIEEYHNNG